MVEPLRLAPAFWRGSKWLWLWWPEPSNIMCSNRWAKPVRPTSSSLEPTWYQTLTATSGIEWSSWRMTSRPLDRVSFSNGMDTISGSFKSVSAIGRYQTGE